MFTKAVIATIFASLVAAQTIAKNGDPADPISRPLNEIVPACKPFTITWTPNTPGPVKITLLKGPSTNVIPQFDIVASTANSGSFVWTPPANLAATSGPTGYGLNLTDLTSGDFQYSTQFGISTDGCAVVSSSAAPAGSSSANGYPVSTPKPTSGYPASTPVKSSSMVLSTGAPCPNSSYVVQPTKPITLPSSLQSSYPTSVVTSKIPQISGNAAPALQAGAGLMGAAAALAFML